MINTYEIRFGGKTETLKGVNLLSALENFGFLGVFITPLWRGRSNGKYMARCLGNNTIFCKWVEKINRLNPKV